MLYLIWSLKDGLDLDGQPGIPRLLQAVVHEAQLGDSGCLTWYDWNELQVTGFSICMQLFDCSSHQQMESSEGLH